MYAVDADVWVLTETHDSLGPGSDYAAVHASQRPFGSDGVVEGSRWVSIWSRHGFVEAEIAVGDRERTVACIVDFEGRRLVIYGTVLPWTNDSERDGMEAELSRQAPEWLSLPTEHDASFCLAGDFNVNLGGPHYYGSNASKEAVATRLRDADLVAMTDFERTKDRRPDYGIIDHIALSSDLAPSATLVDLWGPRTEDGRPMSDHSGVCIEISRAARVGE